MLPAYYKKTQISFLKMLASGDIYQSEHPVNFCTRYETQATRAVEGRPCTDAPLKDVEADDETKRQTWAADLPAKQASGLAVTYRPRQKESTTPPTMAEIAQETLSRSPVQY